MGEQLGLETKGAEILARSGREARDESQREDVAEEGKLQRPVGAAGSRGRKRRRTASDGACSSVDRLRRGHVEVPEAGVHRETKVGHHFGIVFSGFSRSLWSRFLVSPSLIHPLES